MRAPLFLVLGLAVAVGAQAQSPAPPSSGTYLSPGGLRLKLTLSDSNLPEASGGEMTFPPNFDSGPHQHGSIEIFYVVSGALEHVVNGKSEMLTAGMTGFVKPPDVVRHKTGAGGATAMVMWIPGDEAQKIVARWKKETAR